MEKPALKQRLMIIPDADFTPPVDAFELASTAMGHIGDSDPLLRDELIYGSLARWIVNGIFSSQQLHSLATTLLDDHHLGYRLGEKDTDSIFTRSFSMLLLAPILYQHRRQAVFTASEFQSMLQRVLTVFAGEQDLRGFVEEKGWAHAVAHGGDVLDEFAWCHEVQSPDLQRVLSVIQKKICQGDVLFAFDEDERLATPAIAVLQRGVLTLEEVNAWFDTFKAYLEDTLDPPMRMWRAANVRHFLRSMDYRLVSLDLHAFRGALSPALSLVSPYRSNTASDEGVAEAD